MMKIDKDCSFKKAEDAIKLIYERGTINLYAATPDRLRYQVRLFYDQITKDNLNRKTEEQYVATNPYYFTGRLGYWMKVFCAEISIYTIAEAKKGIPLFGGYNTTVLHDNPDISPDAETCSKVLKSLAMIGHMYRK